MTDRTPSPSTPSIDPHVTDERIVATTPQLAARVEEYLGYRPGEGLLEDVLLELDRGAYVEWVMVTPEGEYVWDLSESPDRIADAVAEAAVARLDAWLAGPADD